MDKIRQNICFVGSGSIATALGNALAMKPELDVTLLSIEEEVVNSVNELHQNQKYFPGLPLHSSLKATTDHGVLMVSDMIFMATPSVETVHFLKENKNDIGHDTIIINLAKGFGESKTTIVESLEELLPNRICTLKGPTFARDIMNNQPTAFTLGTRHKELFAQFDRVFKGTHIFLDYSDDMTGVELASILKNIYAIAMGMADAHYDSANLRFLFLTKAFREMKDILLNFGGEIDTMFKYCGYGDFGLTALNDLSRNRTLGLLIGKGFFTQGISHKVILEGRIAVNVFCEKLLKPEQEGSFPIIFEMYKVFNEDYDISQFVDRVLTFEHGMPS